MNITRNTIAALGAAIAVTMLVAGGAGAAQIKAAEPQPGTCKRAFETINGPSVPAAQAMWTQMVAAKYGTKWANWVGASNKTVVPIAGNSGTQFLARARPCFYQPVL